MLFPMTFFSLSELTDATRHSASMQSYQLELLPAIMNSPGVALAERWVRPADCAAVTTGSDVALAGAHYGELVLFRAPADASIRAYQETRERAAQLGNDQAAPQDRLQEFFVPLKAYVKPRVLVAPEVVPFRPARGLYVIVSRFVTHDAAAEAAFRWYDETRIPDLLECRGAAGAWLLATEALFHWQRDLTKPALRLVLVWLDGDPLEFAADVRELKVQDNSAVEEILFAGPLRTIVPWQWDWFDATQHR